MQAAFGRSTLGIRLLFRVSEKHAAYGIGSKVTLHLEESYDSFGNRLGQAVPQNNSALTVAACSATYDAHNRLTTTGVGYGYDNAGNMSSDGANQMAYDADGNLCAVWNVNSGAGSEAFDGGNQNANINLQAVARVLIPSRSGAHGSLMKTWDSCEGATRRVLRSRFLRRRR